MRSTATVGRTRGLTAREASSPRRRASRRMPTTTTPMKTTRSMRSNATLTPFPSDYDALERQAGLAIRAAMRDGIELIELQFPPGALDAAPGDLEGNVECNLTTQRVRGVCRTAFKDIEKNTRVLFPDKIEAKLALTGSSPTPDGIRAPEQSETKAQFADWKGRIDYVDDPNFLSVSGLDKLLNKKVSIAKRMKADDKAFVVAYPSANISELANTRDLYEDAVKGTRRPLVVVNGELERTRSNYYPPFWNMGEMGPLREFAKNFEGVYVIYNFKGSNPAVLFRCYPEPWQVFRRRRGERLELVCTLDAFESVKSIALDVLPRYP